MKKREPFFIFTLSVISFGVYLVYWLYQTRKEVNQNGEKIPSIVYLFSPVLLLFITVFALAAVAASNPNFAKNGLTHIQDSIITAAFSIITLLITMWWYKKFCDAISRISNNQLPAEKTFSSFIFITLVSFAFNATISSKNPVMAWIVSLLSYVAWTIYVQNELNKLDFEEVEAEAPKLPKAKSKPKSTNKNKPKTKSKK